MKGLFIAFAACMLTGCVSPKKIAFTSEAPQVWSTHVGSRVTVVGEVEYQKLGTTLRFEDGTQLWLDRESGIEGRFPAGTVICVTGTVVRDGDLPAYLIGTGHDNGGAHITVKTPEELARIRPKCCLRDVEWEVMK